MRLLLTTLVCLAISATACDNPADADGGLMTGRLGSRSWRGSAVIAPGPADGPMLVSRMRENGAEGQIWVALNPTTPGSYPLGPGDGWYSISPGGGADARYLHVVSGVLTLTSIDSGGVQGSLTLTLRAADGEELQFSEGSFRVESIHRLY